MSNTNREKGIIEQLDTLEAAAKAQQDAIAQCRAQVLSHDHKGAKATGKLIADKAKEIYGVNYEFERDLRSIDAADGWETARG